MFRIYIKEYGKSNKKVLFFLTAWTSTIAQHWVISKLLQFNGYHVITYSYDNSILSPNVQDTVKNCFVVKNQILKQIESLKNQGINTFYILGESMGALLGLMIANSSKDISKIVLNTVGGDLAETVWSWDKAKPWFKNDIIKQGIKLQELKKIWKDISPINNIDNLQVKKILMYISKKDNIIQYESQALTLFNALEQRNYKVKLVTNNYLHHVFTVAYNLLRPRLYLTFINQ